MSSPPLRQLGTRRASCRKRGSQPYDGEEVSPDSYETGSAAGQCPGATAASGGRPAVYVERRTTMARRSCVRLKNSPGFLPQDRPSRRSGSRFSPLLGLGLGVGLAAASGPGWRLIAALNATPLASVVTVTGFCTPSSAVQC